MRIRKEFLFFSLLITRFAFSQDTGFVTNYLIGETTVSIHSQAFNPHRNKVTFINLHDNEQTSVKAAEAYLSACGGATLVQIVNEEERFINICLYGKPYRFDPNRIYSKEGRKYNITRLSLDFNDTVETAVGYLANQIVQCHLINSKLIVAIHNNTDSLLSALSYQQDQADKKHAGAVFINPEMDPDDFILTTDPLIFKRIKERNINVIWENSTKTSDDGSLSVYAGLHKIPYINIEAENDHLEQQLNMLNAIDDIIKEYGMKKTIKKSSRSFKKPLKQSPKKIKKYK